MGFGMLRGMTRLRIGVSACLVGREVRYDGGHKRDGFVSEALAAYVELVPVCPEVELGMGVPREPVRLVQIGRKVAMVGIRSGADHGDEMRAWAEERVRALAALELSGYVLKKNSPSCGMARVKLYGEAGGAPRPTGVGLFAAELMRALPLLPVEEEGRLQDAGLRENFVERVWAYRRLRDFFVAKWTVGGLVGFHTREKLLLMAHDVPAYRQLGALVARAKAMPRGELAERYAELFMHALAKLATRRKQTNVLQHAAGYFKKTLDDGDRAELQAIIAEYHAGQVPLVVPLTLLKHHVRKHGPAWLAEQSWLAPHPQELMLRNHV